MLVRITFLVLIGISYLESGGNNIDRNSASRSRGPLVSLKSDTIPIKHLGKAASSGDPCGGDYPCTVTAICDDGDECTSGDSKDITYH